jgi:uncharacterized protein DUF4238
VHLAGRRTRRRTSDVHGPVIEGTRRSRWHHARPAALTRAIHTNSGDPTGEDIQRARDHHLIPEFYLARFAGPDGQLLVTDKQLDSRKLIHPRVLMKQRDYYTIETIEGPSDAIEKWLSKVEGATAEALRRIDAGAFPPRDEDLGVLSMFVALQLLRGQYLQSMLDDMAQQTTEMTAKILTSIPDAMRAALYRVQGQMPSDEEIQGQQAELTRALEEKRVAATVPRTATIDAMLNALPMVAGIVAQRSWTLIECDAPVFIAADVPVALWSAPLSNGRMMPVGFATADEVTFAIDGYRCILLAHPPEHPRGISGGRYRVGRDFKSLRLLNERHYVYARRFTFQHPDCTFKFNEGRATARHKRRGGRQWRRPRSR